MFFWFLKSKITHRFRFINNLPLNASDQDCQVNFLEYQEITPKKTTTFSWVTDLEITKNNVFKIMRAGWARWKIENETFNTLKNQCYNLEHNYGLGEKYLNENFARLTMLAFLVDQVQQLCCPLFCSVWKKENQKDHFGKKYELHFIHLYLLQWKNYIRHCLLGSKKDLQIWNTKFIFSKKMNILYCFSNRIVASCCFFYF